MILAGSDAFVSHTGNTEYVLQLTDGGAFDGLLVCITSGSGIINIFPGDPVPANRVILCTCSVNATERRDKPFIGLALK